MSHTLRTDIPCLPGLDSRIPNAIFALDNGDLIAFAVETTSTPAATLAFTARAWLVDADGDMQAVAGAPVATRFQHAADAHQVTTLGVQGIANAMRDLLLGELPGDPPVIEWADDLRAQLNIRNVATIARAMGTPIDFGAGS